MENKIHVWNHQPVYVWTFFGCPFLHIWDYLGAYFCFTPFTPFGSWQPIRSKSPQRRCCRDRWAIALCPSISRHKPRRGTRSSFMAPGDSGVMKLMGMICIIIYNYIYMYIYTYKYIIIYLYIYYIYIIWRFLAGTPKSSKIRPFWYWKPLGIPHFKKQMVVSGLQPILTCFFQLGIISSREDPFMKPFNNVLLVKIEGPGAGIPSIIKQTCC